MSQTACRDLLVQRASEAHSGILVEHRIHYILTEADLRQSTRRKGFMYTDIDMVCGNKTPSRWRGQTSSAIKASDGYTYYARQLTREKELEDCGT